MASPPGLHQLLINLLMMAATVPSLISAHATKSVRRTLQSAAALALHFYNLNEIALVAMVTDLLTWPAHLRAVTALGQAHTPAAPQRPPPIAPLPFP